MDKPVFVTGMTGTGKTVMVQNLLRSLEPYADEGGLAVVPTFMNFSAQTLSLITQQAIESKLEKKRKNLLGAPAGKKCIFFVDDINMPLVRARRFMKVPSLPYESWPSHVHESGFFFEFELFRAASGPSRRVRENEVAAMASSRDHVTVRPSS